MQAILWVGFGGMVGALMRFAAMGAVAQLLGRGFPYATLSVNLLGSLLLGVLVGIKFRYGLTHPALSHFAIIGLLGSFTTFSTFSLDVFLLMERGEWLLAAGYMLASFVACVAALSCGVALSQGSFT